MQRVAPSLHSAARILAILAVVVGLLAGCVMTYGVSFVACFDTCYSPDFYLSYTVPAEIRFMTPCLVLAALALVVFLAYCLATHQLRRALLVLLFFLVGGLVGVAVLNGLVQLAQLSLANADSLHINDEAAAWVRWWGPALTLVVVVWCGVLARLEHRQSSERKNWRRAA
jgi:hypothetical protein